MIPEGQLALFYSRSPDWPEPENNEYGIFFYYTERQVREKIRELRGKGFCLFKIRRNGSPWQLVGKNDYL